MKTILNLMIAVLLAALVLLAIVNGQTLMAVATIELLFTQVEVPLGASLLGLCGALAALFAASATAQQLSAAGERRRMMVEQDRLRVLAERAEASRLEELRREMADEFRRLNDRLTQGVPTQARGLPAPGAS